jgi:hypothetical protein
MKMTLVDVYDLPITLSLAVIVGVVAVAIAASLLRAESVPTDRVPEKRRSAVRR